MLDRPKRKLLGQRKKGTSKGCPLAGEGKYRDWLGNGKKVSQQEVLTSWRGPRLQLVRIQKERELVRGTYFLESVNVRTNQDMERK